MKTALVTGVNGQDGSYMADLLLEKGYRVYGTVRSKNPVWPYGFEPNRPYLHIRQLDLGQPDSIHRLWDTRYSECYNFAAQSHVGHSFSAPGETYAVTGVGACLLMDAFFSHNPEGKFYQASTSEMFGGSRDSGQITLEDAFAPQSPYAVAKLMAHYATMRQRDHGQFVISGVLFNHESERRHESFVTQKVAKFVAKAKRWSQTPTGDRPILELGYIESCRDWGYAPEYMEAVYNSMQKNYAAVWLLGTGVSLAVRQMVRMAFEIADLNWMDFVRADSASENRPQEVEYLCASPTDLCYLLGRKPKNISEVIQIMVESQLRQIR